MSDNVAHQPPEKLDTPHTSHATPDNMNPSNFQVGAREMKQMGGNGSEAAGLPSADSVLNTSGHSDSLQRTPAEMQSVDRNSEVAQKMFPNSPSSDIYGPKDAAYRYLMNGEHVDDYSASAAKDKATLEKTGPDTIPALDREIARAQAHGPVPGAKPELINQKPAEAKDGKKDH